MKKLIILSAVPGSGKSTWAKKYQSEHPNTYIISSDQIRFELTGVYQDFSRQKEVWEIFEQRIKDYFSKPSTTDKFMPLSSTTSILASGATKVVLNCLYFSFL